MSKYRLLKRYPSLPEDWEVGMKVSKTNPASATYPNRYYPCKRKYKCKYLGSEEVENNLEYWEKVEEKDYEILSIKSKISGDVIDNRCGDIDAWEAGYGRGWDIESVKRLSDNEIFSIGDRINFHKNVSKIVRFKEDDSWQGHLWAEGENSNDKSAITVLQKAKEPLFVTEDGVEIFEGDKFWIASSDYNVYSAHGGNKLPKWIRKKFSTEEKAEEWIELNKPKYSKNNINEMIKIYNKNIKFEKFWDWYLEECEKS